MVVLSSQCRSALNRSAIPGMDYCLNPYTGCLHACVYCYASFMKRFCNNSRPWGSFVQVKENFPERLAAQLRRPKRGKVMVGSVTDAYQPVEKERGLTRACLGILADSGLDICILTKSDLILRDLDLLSRMPRLEVGFTLTVVDDTWAHLLEPGASLPSQRLKAMAALAASGVKTWAFVAPVIPGLGDAPGHLESLLRAIRKTGTREVLFDPLNFYPSAVTNLHQLFSRHFPHLLPAFRKACRSPEAFRRNIRLLTSSLR